MAEFIRIPPPDESRRELDTGDAAARARRAAFGGAPPQGGDGPVDGVRPNGEEAGGSGPLETLRRSGQTVEVRLRGGASLFGRLLGFDRESLIVELDGEPAVVFKHAVDLVRPAR